GRTVVVLTFTGADIIGGSLADGNYTLTVRGDRVHDRFGRELDGDGDGTPGGDRVDGFFRLYGTATATATWTCSTWGGSSARSAPGGAPRASWLTWISTATIGWVSSTCSPSSVGSART